MIECDTGEDEEFCNTPNWHQWVAIASILLFFVVLFFSVLKFKLKDKEEMLETKLHPLNSQHFSLDKEYRGQLVLRLKTGGRDEAVKIYDQICKETNHQTWYLKVCSFNMFIRMEYIFKEHVPRYKDFKSIDHQLDFTGSQNERKLAFKRQLAKDQLCTNRL